MKSWLGKYTAYNGAEQTEVSVLAFPEKISIGITGPGDIHTPVGWSVKDIVARYDMSEQATLVTHRTEKGRLLIPGKDAMEFIELQQQEDSKPWFRKTKSRENKRLLYLFTATVAVLVSVYFLIVPWMAEKMAEHVSIQTEEDFGNSIFEAMSLPEQQEQTILVNDFFKQMHITTAYDIRITVVESDIINAFALPGGHIVVYTGLLKKLETYPELAALLSHEFTHVDKRHATRSIFRKLGSRIFLSLMLGRMGAVTSVMVDQADNLKSLNYSRKLEKEADLSGLNILKERNIDPEGFVQLFDKLSKASTGDQIPEFLGSHPDIKNRIAYIESASGDAKVNENAELKSIFEKLK